MKLVATKKVTSRVAKDIITEFANQQDVDLLQIIHDRGLVVDFTQKQLEEMASQVVADNPSVVSDYRAGKEAALQFLIGQIMKKTRGTANPESVAQTLRGILDM